MTCIQDIEKGHKFRYAGAVWERGEDAETYGVDQMDWIPAFIVEDDPNGFEQLLWSQTEVEPVVEPVEPVLYLRAFVLFGIMDRLRVLAFGGIRVTTTVKCERSPGRVLANTVFDLSGPGDQYPLLRRTVRGDEKTHFSK